MSRLACSAYAVILAVAMPEPSQAGLTLSMSPGDSWNIFQVVGLGQGNSTTFEPTKTYWAGAIQLSGYYADSLVASGNVFGSGDEDTLRIFTTSVYSTADFTLTVYVGGDDGHTLYFNDALMLAAPTGGPLSTVTLDFHAGINTIEAAVYNGPGASLFQLTTSEADPPSGLLSSVPGLEMDATGSFSAVPEPSSLALFGCGIGVLMVLGHAATVFVEQAAHVLIGSSVDSVAGGSSGSVANGSSQLKSAL